MQASARLTATSCTQNRQYVPSPSPGYRLICSILLVPLHCNVMVISTCSNLAGSFRSLNKSSPGFLTSPPMAIEYLLTSLTVGIPPWLRTKWISFGVMCDLSRSDLFGSQFIGKSRTTSMFSLFSSLKIFQLSSWILFKFGPRARWYSFHRCPSKIGLVDGNGMSWNSGIGVKVCCLQRFERMLAGRLNGCGLKEGVGLT